MVLMYKNIKKRIEEGKKKSDMGQAIVKRDQWLCHPINLIAPPAAAAAGVVLLLC
jgi:hypothetical protein